MNQAQVFHRWGSTHCIPGLCTWQGHGNASHAERATVSFYRGAVIQIDINAGTIGTNLKFKPGQLSKWKTGKNIHLGSTRDAVKRAYPAAKANNAGDRSARDDKRRLGVRQPGRRHGRKGRPSDGKRSR
jgi:hypothetical protein